MPTRGRNENEGCSEGVYRYDERGNLAEKLKNGERVRYQWNAGNQLIRVETAEVVTQFIYDPLGRRVVKHSEPIVATRSVSRDNTLTTKPDCTTIATDTTTQKPDAS